MPHLVDAFTSWVSNPASHVLPPECAAPAWNSPNPSATWTWNGAAAVSTAWSSAAICAVALGDE